MGTSIGASELIIILIGGIGTLVIIGILFYLIKSAIQAGVRDAYRERNSGTAFEFKQTKLLAEIARANGVSEEKIQEILKENT
ncbi:hypothetical protein GCM10027566_08080 [Arachidicoccus ginsenosidivorans]|jgi:hypothetical protein|uniref:Uncharacterized protein n=1 Tax=Arachidicoccus ginsenosidivorans TaxID=496057 RepID=A0A5B8VS20_9BACT|nr:hypothetical protein [Arachidicoccus ginsenosidivorans]QEC73375.1 hypothetical protein FSB73_18605 [Arachidicoccus ginsenosidivorans]